MERWVLGSLIVGAEGDDLIETRLFLGGRGNALGKYHIGSHHSISY